MMMIGKGESGKTWTFSSFRVPCLLYFAQELFWE
jgi:hypothetical protein